jgi:TonB family protein
MSAFSEIWIRSSVLLMVAFGMAALLRARPASVRHAVLVAALASTIAIGIGVSAGPRWTIALPVWAAAPATHPETPNEPAAVAVAGTSGGSSLPVATTTALDLTAVWLIGVAAFTAHLVVRLLRLRRLTRSGTPVTSGCWPAIAERLQGARDRPVRLLCVDDDHVLATCGARHPTILIPRHALGWPEGRVEAVLRHELAHVVRQDWAVHLAALGVRALYWFNPLVWLACRQLRVEAERACDEAVVRQGLPVREYAVHLIDIARACGRPASRALVVPMSRKSVLERRITSMLSSLPTWPSRRAIVVIIGCLACAGLALSTVRLAARAPQGVSGTVYDASGGIVAGAKVMLDGQEPQHFEAETNPDGKFELTAIPPGRYTLSVSLAGFKTFQESLDLQASSAWSRVITLQLGDVQETINVRSTRLAPRDTKSAPIRVRVGGNVEPPRKTHDVRPVYPESMREAGIEGVVPLEAIIDRAGTVQSVRVLTAAVHPELVRAAADAVRQWRFDPTRLNGTPVEVVMNVSITFELER